MKNEKSKGIYLANCYPKFKMKTVLDNVSHVVKNSKHVRIDKEGVREFSKNFNAKGITRWLDHAPFNIKKLSSDDMLAFLFVLESTSFCYWGNPKWTVGYKGKIYDGAWGLIASLGKAIEENKPILDPAYLRNISERETEGIFRGNVRIPLFEERVQVLRELGRIVTKKYEGSFSKIIEDSNKNALKLVDNVVKNFPLFNDFAVYKGKKIYFHKRAQLLASDISNFISLKNAEHLTACADYKLPKVLRERGILDYSNELAEKVDNQVEIPKGSSEEIEIRANTIFGVELIKAQLKNKIPGITSKQINDFLWLEGQKTSELAKPYHRTITTAY